MIIRGVEMEACIQGIIRENLMPFLECTDYLTKPSGGGAGMGPLCRENQFNCRGK